MSRLLLICALLSALLFSGCGDTPDGNASANGNAITVGLAQLPLSVDPRYATDAASHRVQEFLHRGLVRLDEKFLPQPDLAESWQHPDPLTWEFKLRPGIRFHDGSSVRASDVTATLNAVLDSAGASPLRAGLAAIARVTVLADDSLRIELSRPDASLLTRLELGVLPASLAKQPHSPKSIVGCGPYRLKAWNGNTLDITPVTEASLPIRFLGVKDPVTRSLKLVRGELDFTQGELPPHLIPYLQKQSGIEIQYHPSTTFSYIGLNLQDKYLKDVRVRRALALGLDRERLKKALFSDLPELAETVLTSSHWAAAKLPPTPFDAVQAEKLLDAAGFKRDAGGIRFRITYRTSTDPTRLRLVTAIADSWQKIGVQVAIESLEWGGFYARIKRGDFQAFSLDWVGITDPDIYRWILHSDMWPPAGSNRGRYSNTQMDSWLDAAAISEERAERIRLYANVQQQMQADQVYIPLWYQPVIAVSGPRIRGFKPSPDGSLLSLRDVRAVN
ncbi:MAG: ABC transporter substrate-binding protein [Mariprofundaceae bacterium]|nr:ABC transporter substrate-binding protein [Mariprofundaceae bacterium]